MVDHPRLIIGSLLRHITAPRVGLRDRALLFLVLLTLDLLLNVLVLGLQEVKLLQLQNLVSQDSILSVSFIWARVPLRVAYEFVVFPKEVAAAE